MYWTQSVTWRIKAIQTHETELCGQVAAMITIHLIERLEQGHVILLLPSEEVFAVFQGGLCQSQLLREAMQNGRRQHVMTATSPKVESVLITR